MFRMIYLEFLFHNTLHILYSKRPRWKPDRKNDIWQRLRAVFQLTTPAKVTLEATIFLNRCIAGDKEPSLVSLDFPPSALLPLKNDIDSMLKLVINHSAWGQCHTCCARAPHTESVLSAAPDTQDKVNTVFSSEK